MTGTKGDSPREDEQSVALTREYRVIQKLRGHRYSVDDMLVGHLAGTLTPAPRRVLDLGCGLGSVLLITAWAFPDAQLVGLEVVAEHVDFARRNVALNRCQDRIEIVAGDLRDLALVASLGRFDLVTGSPPYFLPGSGTPCADPARAAAHFELRGGIEEYARAASVALAPGGRFVACAPADPPERARAALHQAGLAPVFEQPVVPRERKPPFLTLLVAGAVPDDAFRSAHPSAAPAVVPPLVLRDDAGNRTAEHLAIRAWTGVPSSA
jgi:tRNA1Val (adenine37-N6)-methyltransferase